MKTVQMYNLFSKWQNIFALFFKKSNITLHCPSERCEGDAGKLEMLQTKGNADDGAAKQ